MIMPKEAIWMLLFLLGGFLCFACRSDWEKEGVVSKEKMVEVLYDYQLATALSEQAISQEEQKEGLRLKLSVFAKHQISQAIFDKSLAHYSRNSDDMKEIYREMQKRYNLQGQLIEEEKKKAKSVGEYDTIMLWQKRGVSLNASFNNQFALSLPAVGKSLRQGDELLLRFKVDWLYRQGNAEAHALLALELDNDSVLKTSLPLYGYMSHQELRLKCSTERKVKRTTLQVYQKAKWSETTQLLFLSHLELMNIRPKKKAEVKPKQKAVTDSLSASSDSASLSSDSLTSLSHEQP